MGKKEEDVSLSDEDKDKKKRPMNDDRQPQLLQRSRKGFANCWQRLEVNCCIAPPCAKNWASSVCDGKTQPKKKIITRKRKPYSVHLVVNI